MHYLIALRLNQPLQRALVDGIELVRFNYLTLSCDKHVGSRVFIYK